MTFNPNNTDYSYEKIEHIICGYIQKSNGCQDHGGMKRMIVIQLTQINIYFPYSSSLLFFDQWNRYCYHNKHSDDRCCRRKDGQSIITCHIVHGSEDGNERC